MKCKITDCYGLYFGSSQISTLKFVTSVLILGGGLLGND
jgi:hypothetical protein